MTGLTIFWLVLMIAFIVAEVFSMGFISMWFAAGSLVALVSTYFTSSFTVQFIVFAVVSAISLALFMKPLKDRFQKRAVPTNADSNVGRVAMCIVSARGSSLARVRLDGVDWNARCANDLEVGAECRIVSITGATLNVEPVSNAVV